ncbi:proteasome assembly chaperone 3-like [Sipha flava]|uniref:Proteasome assembly chaperone 3-like n=1 Tax=Sipha flava TaxID=143950 RepID=A0A8B8F8U8_9HEMI|nr:proteasome assembly chaperone 3-like [Sipha flava]
MNFKSVAALLDGVHTDFTVSVFEDIIFIVITQNSKLGTLYLFKPECLSSKDQGYDIKALFGREDDNLTSHIVSLMLALNVDRRAIVSLMLSNTSFRTIRAIQEVLSSMI